MDTQQYEDWLVNREPILQELWEHLNEEIRVALDFSPDSLQTVGGYLVENFSSLTELYKVENRPIYLGFATYSFEVFRRNLKLEPRLPQEDKQYEYYGIPVLTFSNGRDISPFTLIVLTVNRQDPDLLKWVYNNQPQQIAEDMAVAEEANDSSEILLSDSPELPQLMSEIDFTSWLTFLTDRIEAFIFSLDENIQQHLNFSPESLQVIGEIIVSHTTDTGKLIMSANFFCDLYSYVGEVFHRNLGFQFFLAKDQDYSPLGQPAIRNTSGLVLKLPEVIIEAAKQRKSGSLLESFENIRDSWMFNTRENN
jgi:hypothetical protein